MYVNHTEIILHRNFDIKLYFCTEIKQIMVLYKALHIHDLATLLTYWALAKVLGPLYIFTVRLTLAPPLGRNR